MRGSPLQHTAAAVAGLLFIGVVLFRMTHSANADHPAVPERPDQTVATMIFIRTSHPLAKLTLRQDSRTILDLTEPEDGEWEIESQLVSPEDGTELVLEAVWKSDADRGHAAITVQVEPDAFETKSLTEWSDENEIEAYFNFQWP